MRTGGCAYVHFYTHKKRYGTHSFFHNVRRYLAVFTTLLYTTRLRPEAATKLISTTFDAYIKYEPFRTNSRAVPWPLSGRMSNIQAFNARETLVVLQSFRNREGESGTGRRDMQSGVVFFFF